MYRSFWNGTAISFAAYAAAIAIGFGIDFRLTAFLLVALQVTWTLFCVARFIQLRVRRAYRPEAEPFERRDYGFALGGSISSVALLVAVVVLTQVV